MFLAYFPVEESFSPLAASWIALQLEHIVSCTCSVHPKYILSSSLVVFALNLRIHPELEFILNIIVQCSVHAKHNTCEVFTLFTM